MSGMDFRARIAKALALVAVAAGLCCHALPSMAAMAAVSAPLEAVGHDCGGHAGTGQDETPAADGGRTGHACCIAAPADVAPASPAASVAAAWTADLPHADGVPARAGAAGVSACATGPPAVNRALASLGTYRS